MSDPRSPDEYDWLYGKPQQAASTPPPPRQSPRSSNGSNLPPPHLPPPGRRSGDGGRPPRRKRSLPRVLGIIALVWLVFLAAVPLYAWSRIDKVDADPGGDRPGEQPGTTYLLVGSDSREDLSDEEREQLTTGDAGGERTDTMLLLHTGSGPTLLMSIPRDSIVDIPDNGRTKINAAYAFGGPKLLVQTIEQNTGIRVDDYVEVGFGGLVAVVDALGGIEICPEEDLKDKDSGLDVKAGCQNADGPTALGFARNRKSFGTGDIQRVQNQREVIGSIGSAAKSPWTVVNPLRYMAVGSSAAESLTIGEDVGPISLGRFALALSGAMGGDGLNCTVPVQDFEVNWDAERAPAMFDLIKTDRTGDIGDLCTEDGLPAS